MNQEQQRIAIAEACAWTESPSGKWHHEGFMLPDPLNPPDYLNDLNAMTEAVMSLPEEMQNNYLGYLAGICEVKMVKDVFRMHNATAAQRAEAFLKTLNLWKP
jgi:hypothetical protein